MKLRKIALCALASCLVLSAAGCGKKNNTDANTTGTPAPTSATANTPAPTPDADPTTAPEPTPAVKVMSYNEFLTTEKDQQVCVETNVLATRVYKDGKTCIYAQDENGAYFVYDYACTEEEYKKLTRGSRIRVTGTKAEWSGEVEITSATVDFLSGSYIAPATDLTSCLADADALEKYKNCFASFTGMTVTAIGQDDAGKDCAYFYNWNGAGSEGDDLYFSVSRGDAKYTFLVESDLCAPDSEVYKAVKNLKIGDVIDMEGFVYWYNGIQSHITKISASTKKVLSYAEYAALELKSDATVTCYVQAVQAYNADAQTATVYAADPDGAYFIYGMACTKEEYDALKPGTAILVSGTKDAWSGEVELTNASFVFAGGNYVATPTDLTDRLDAANLVDNINCLFTAKGLTVAEIGKDDDDQPCAFFYGWNGAGAEGGDLYFKVTLNGKDYTFLVESDLCNSDSEVYNTVKNLKIGDKINVEGFLYWYNGAQPHITKITK